MASAALSAATPEPAVGKPLVVMGRAVPDLCPIHRMTGHSCPGCGMSRAFVLLWRGRLWQALRSNPASPFVFAALVWLALEPMRPSQRRQFTQRPSLPSNPQELRDTWHSAKQ